MVTKYCRNCKTTRTFKRHFSIGTLILVLLTGFLWVLVMPFYPRRCATCYATEELKP